jgi:hypothetical protein
MLTQLYTEIETAPCWAVVMTMEAARTSETSVNVYQTTRRNNPEGSHLYTRRRPSNLTNTWISKPKYA